MAIPRAIAKLTYLQQYEVEQWNTSSLNPNRLKFLAPLGRKSTNQWLQRAPKERRYPILVAFVCQIRVEIVDEAMDLFIQCLADIYARARRDVETFRQQEAKAINEKVIYLYELARVVLDPMIADEQREVRSASTEALESWVSNRIPQVDLTDPLIEIDQLTGFSQHFIYAGGNPTRSEETQVYLYATILAQACNLGLKAIAQISDLSYE